MFLLILDVGRGVPLLHLYGEAGGRPPVPTLFEVVLLCVREAMAYGAKVPVSSLPRGASPARAGELPLGGRSHAADRDHAADQHG